MIFVLYHVFLIFYQSFLQECRNKVKMFISLIAFLINARPYNLF